MVPWQDAAMRTEEITSGYIDVVISSISEKRGKLSATERKIWTLMILNSEESWVREFPVFGVFDRARARSGH